MLFLVAALLLLGILMGAVAHVPLTVSAVAGALVVLWLAGFAFRERYARRHR